MPRVAPIAGHAAAGLGGLLRDVDRLFVPPRPLPSPDARARAVIDALDWSQPLVAIWLPGTNEHEIAADVTGAFDRVGLGNVAHVPYQATWRLSESVPDGEATLRAVLDLARTRLRRGQRLVLLGQSQGAWVISSILREPAYARLVERAALVAHPAVAPAHAHETALATDRLPRTVREFNEPSDVVTRDLGRSAEAALRVVDSFARLEVGRALAGAIGVALRDPGVLQALVASQLFRLRGETNPHETGGLLDDAVRWVLAGGARDSAA